MFARILANTAQTETQANPELSKAKQTITKLRLDLEEVERRAITWGIIGAETASVTIA
jgi:multidrug resistance efflux pump